MEQDVKNIDTNVTRCYHSISTVNHCDCDLWLQSPITKALMSYLDMCGIVCALQFDPSVTEAKLHLIVPHDIKKAMIDKQKEAK